MSEQTPAYAKRGNARWVFLSLLVLCVAAIGLGIWQVAVGIFSGWFLMMTAGISSVSSVYWLRRLARERREDQPPSE
jgi:heme A synthase